MLINANDALHSSRRDLIHEYCRILRRRFPRIEYLFCGFGGASYFPNCIRVPGKDDIAVARARETFFLQNFALIAELLQPRQAFPFAAHFVLPDAHTWWISQTRLAMERPSETVRRLSPRSRIEFFDLQPGDFVKDGVVNVSEPPVDVDGDARGVVLKRYPPAASRTPLAFDDVVRDVRAAIARHARRDDLNAVVALWDIPERALHITVQGGSVKVQDVTAEEVHELQSEVVFETRSDLLQSTMHSAFGRDLISIGYGCEVRLRSRAEMARAPHERLLNLLAPPQPR